GGAGLTAGIGAGVGIGGVMTEALRGMTGSQASSSGVASGAAAGAAVGDVMTPAEAASYVKVSEEDILAAIESGELKAKKIGNAFRISKSALDSFLSGG
ncbi:MAG TPA: helix-turn-helix domain-containing protein, partial [Anaerolineales bacterium]|nr:helix-turn-helix domain-containing protein [Anaerolineales bacterium]